MEDIMLQGLFGNASEVDIKSLQKDLDASWLKARA
jgi:hypothetical protein